MGVLRDMKFVIGICAGSPMMAEVLTRWVTTAGDLSNLRMKTEEIPEPGTNEVQVVDVADRESKLSTVDRGRRWGSTVSTRWGTRGS